jgi:hypothetical protein
MNFIKRLFAKKGIERKLPIIHVYTFSGGEKIYTYLPEDFGKISSRYYRAVQEANNYLLNFGMTKQDWEAAVTTIKNDIAKTLQRPTMDKAVKQLMDINSVLDVMDAKAKGMKGAEEIWLETMFCMFFLLEDEKETGYSESHNKRKLSLLNSEPEARDFFLPYLNKQLERSMPISQDDTLKFLLELQKIEGQLRSLITPINLTN